MLISFLPVANLVYSGDGADVDTVIIDSRILMVDREIKRVDEGKSRLGPRRLVPGL